MSPTFVCECRPPKPRPNGTDGLVCVSCHGRIKVTKKSERARGVGDTMPADDLQAIQDRINRLKSSVDTFCEELTAQVQRLKKQN